jgi:hypothetical protein
LFLAIHVATPQGFACDFKVATGWDDIIGCIIEAIHIVLAAKAIFGVTGAMLEYAFWGRVLRPDCLGMRAEDDCLVTKTGAWKLSADFAPDVAVFGWNGCARV